MAISPYRPTPELFSPLFEEFFRPATGASARLGGMLRSPDADVVEAQNEIRVLVELPGMRAEDIQLDLENNVLTISGEKHEERNEETDTWHLSERRYGKFSRSFVLPRDVEQDRIQASFAEGVLTVSIPKSERARRRRIEVSQGDGQRSVGTGKQAE